MSRRIQHTHLHSLSRDLAGRLALEMPPSQLQERSGGDTSAVAASIASLHPSTTSATKPIDTIAPYATELNGVNQGMNYLNRDILWWAVGILCILVLTTRLYYHAFHQFRLLSSLGANNSVHNYWSINFTTWYPKLKKHLIYAPLGSKRHNHEKTVAIAKWKIGFGTIPSRAHLILLAIWVIGNAVCCCWLDFAQPNRYALMAELRGRSGFLAVANLLVMLILVARNNPLLGLLQLSFDDMNLFHRWIGRLVVLESLVHTIAWGIVKHAASGSFVGINEAFREDPFIIWGVVATAVMMVMVVASLSHIRHAFYETFLHGHIIMAIISFVGVYMHCKIANLPQLIWMEWAFALWGAERCFRIVNILYPNFRFAFWQAWGAPLAEVEVMPGTEACRVTIHLPKSISIKAGSHAYIRLGGISMWQCHPFSIAWTSETPVCGPDDQKSMSLPTSTEKSTVTRRSAPKVKTTTSASFIIGAHTGFTRKLYNRAVSSPSGRFTTTGLLEGPYGCAPSLDSYGTVLLFAGATGITHQLPYVKHLVSSYSLGTTATKRIVLIWVIRDVPSLEWIRKYMDEVLRMPGRRDVLCIKIFVTRPLRPNAVLSPSQTVQMFPGRPNLEEVIHEEVGRQIGAMCVSVCGPGSMCDSIREVVRGVQEDKVVDLLEESFTW